MQQDQDTARGTVEEALPNALFRVVLEEDGTQVLAYLAGKMRMHRIKVLVGDTVLLKLDPYGGRARITRRM